MLYHGGRKTGWGWIVWILVVVGALNWGLVGISGFMDQNWNVVNLIFNGVPSLELAIYVLVGVAGLVLLFGGLKKRG